MSPFKFLQRLAGIGLEVLFPAICCECGRLYKPDANASLCPPDVPLPIRFRSLMAQYLCAACSEQLQMVRSPLCPQCGQPFDATAGPDHLCGPCIAHPFRFQAARAVGLYRGILRSIIHQYKYQGRDNMAGPLGRLLWQSLAEWWGIDWIDMVVPVPLHARRLRQRGFNQAHALVRQWPRLAALAGERVGPAWVDAAVLRRHRFTLSQTGLAKKERMGNIRNAFSVRTPGQVQGKRILLVDDVFTTGATADACAGVLLKAGASEVRVLTLARAVL